ncbi:hypothetical protein LTR47_003520 [Exophiala xenobiotica]|nr:hypothetical protein LTR92_008010 [Exophiala xenobiotica]KAK5205189.1 hypothetical protein LTR41_009038 [Exophiala xenobiotica]KAK5219032.1 hypothetical protein LTR72_008214 [Exophiala xenobiotica]KAK5235335.1 hypothetical protein LTR47_003520 [Exophiala xenobiotica]KAK5250018.1 hypothetical protein LTS06_005079 [Exophiala xenobiotica]
MSEEPKASIEFQGAEEDDGHEHPSKRFRFKSKRENDVREEDNTRGHKRRRHHESSHAGGGRRKSSKRSRDHTPTQSHSLNSLPPDQAFRESLFDALGDDEGAAFWEGVYGQPIHDYPNTYKDEETGELERMTDEEYAQFVRRKMWEKSWEGIEAAKEEKRREREQEKQRIREEENKRNTQRQAQHDDYVFDTQVEASLRRGERRKDRRRWHALWQDYLRRWEELQATAQNRPKLEEDREQVFLRNKIAWPVESGKRKDVHRDEVERFVRKGTASLESDENTGDPLVNALKTERVRWHPDKIQQRYGFMEIDESTLKGVTAVFQIFDDIWAEVRKTGS